MKLNDNQSLVLSFAALILAGAYLLWLPVSYSAGKISFVDALFTSTSAVCVTGLTVVDTAKFSPFGQSVLIFLIQLGGIGILTFSTFFILTVGGRLPFQSRLFIQGNIRGYAGKDLFHTFKAILFYTFLIEIIGAGFLYLEFSQNHTVYDAVFESVFHSIAAFCNAGFSTFSDNLTGYCGDVGVNIAIMGLIISGGLGFLVLDDVFQAVRAFLQRKEYQLAFHSRIMLWMTGGLILTGALIFYGLERENVLKELPLKTQVLASFFQSVTPRTAGYNTVDLGKITDPTAFFITILMFIGAGPNSTGGGIKVSTFAILMALIVSRLRSRKNPSIFRRKIPEDAVGRSIAIFAAALLLILADVILIQVLEHYGLPHPAAKGAYLEVLFETVSAFGTVGLSMGITPLLSCASKLVLIFTMFAGRLGPLTLAFAIGMKDAALDRYEYPEEDVMVG